MSGAIDTAITTAYQGTSVIVRNATAIQRSPGAPRGPIGGSVLTSVRAVPGVANAEGEVAGFGELMGSNGKPVTGPGPRAAGNWLTDPLLNPWHLVSGTPPRGPDEVVVDQASAAKGGLRAGQRTTILTPQPVQVTITGTADYGTQPSDGGSSYAAFTLAGGQQHLLSGKDQLSAIVARGRPGLTQAQLASAIKTVVPPGTQVITGQQAASEQIAAVNNAFLPRRHPMAAATACRECVNAPRRRAARWPPPHGRKGDTASQPLSPYPVPDGRRLPPGS
jgi:putative ABC transport system permease protein